MLQDVKPEVIGRWHGILTCLGVDIGDGRHKPCPVCGGRDRFRFDDKDGRGTWFCNNCGAGDGWDLVQNYFKTDFMGAVAMVSPIICVVERKQIKKGVCDDKARVALNKLWLDSKPLNGKDWASEYLSSRGLDWIPNNVRFCPKCYESDTKKFYPAMVALVHGTDGMPVTIHRTYLSAEGKADVPSPKKLMTGVCDLRGAAIRLCDPTDILGVAEGIETAMACKQLFGTPTWATVSSTLMVSFTPPQSVKKIIIYGDNDKNFAGQKAAYELAHRLGRDGFAVVVEISECDGTDWADVLEGRLERHI